MTTDWAKPLSAGSVRWVRTDTPSDLVQDVIQQTVPTVRHLVSADPLIPGICHLSAPSPTALWNDIKQFDFTLVPHERAVTESIRVSGYHPFLGIECENHHKQSDLVTLLSLRPGSTSQKSIPHWRSTIKGSIIYQVGDVRICDKDQLADVIRKAC